MTIAAAGTVAIGDLVVPRLGFGTMRLPGPGVLGPPTDRAEAVRVLRRAVELGVRVIDTAWYYGPGVADEIVAEALHPYPDDLVIITKLGAGRRPSGAWHTALGAADLRAGCERDLRLLGIDSIPVVHLRWMPNRDATFDDALATFLEMHAEGKIRRIGLSNVTADQLDRALQDTDIVTVSNAYNVVDRSDDPLVARCERDGIAYLPFFPLGATTMSPGAGAAGDAGVTAVAARLGASPVQVALAWLLRRSPALLPIPGTSSVAHLEDNLGAADLVLSDDDMALLQAP